MDSSKTQTSNSTKEKIENAIKSIKDCDCILIGAGAGLSVDAGLDYHDRVSFKKHFPAMWKRGFRYPYQFIGKKDWDTQELAWGYIFGHVNMINELPKHEVYESLLKIVSKKNYFVVTSNVDGFFRKNGFDEKKIYTPQGDFKYIQCINGPCKKNSFFESKKYVKNGMENLDFSTQELKDKKCIPKCPNCKGDCFFNVRGGKWFLHTAYDNMENEYIKWINNIIKKGKKLVILEIGAGFNTPMVIRWRNEKLTHAYENVKFIRINYEYDEVPKILKKKSICFKSKAIDCIRKILQGM